MASRLRGRPWRLGNSVAVLDQYSTRAPRFKRSLVEWRSRGEVAQREAAECPRRHFLDAEDVRLVGSRELDHLVQEASRLKRNGVAVEQVPAPHEHQPGVEEAADPCAETIVSPDLKGLRTDSTSPTGNQTAVGSVQCFEPSKSRLTPN